MTMPPRSEERVTVVVVSYNSAHCVPALAEHLSHMPHVTVVDNASTDDTIAQFQQHIPHARVIRNPVNRGFGAANNLALQALDTPYALLLNPDCTLDESGLAALVEFALAHPDVAMVAPQLTDAANRPQVNYRWPSGLWTSRGPGAQGPCCVGFASGACLLLNMERMKTVGFFDETFFLYYEDDDLCMRVFQAHLPIVILPHVRAVHTSRGSVGGQARWRSEYGRGYHHAQSKIRYTAKYHGRAQAMRLRLRVLGLALLTLPLRLLLPSPRQVGRLLGRIHGLVRAKP